MNIPAITTLEQLIETIERDLPLSRDWKWIVRNDKAGRYFANVYAQPEDGVAPVQRFPRYGRTAFDALNSAYQDAMTYGEHPEQ